jgi:hypothetical protein
MRTSIWLLLSAALFHTAASANDITIYFGRPEYHSGTDTSTFVADSAFPGGLAVPAGTYTLGIWANVGYDSAADVMDVWNCVSFDIVARTPSGAVDPCVTASGFLVDNFDHRIGMGTAFRWEYEIEYFSEPLGVYAFSIDQHGLGGLWTRDWGMGNGFTDWWSYADGPVGEAGTNYRYWLGNVTLTCNDATAVHNVFFMIGDAGIVRSGGTAEGDLIWFGEDETVPLHGDEFGAVSATPDFVFMPEPISVALLSVAGLCLRRR